MWRVQSLYDTILLPMRLLSMIMAALRMGLVIASFFALLPSMVHAGSLTRAQLQQRMGESLTVGEQLTALPVWPVFHRNMTAPGSMKLYAYVFETVDIEPVAGYGGKPINILVVMNPAGKFMDVRLLSHNEPIFQAPAANALLAGFAEQYIDLTMHHSIQVLGYKAQRVFDDQKATLHGVSAGTVSVTAMDRAIMEAASQVAYAKLDDPKAKRDATQTRGPDDKFERMGWNQLVSAKLVQPIKSNNALQVPPWRAKMLRA
jgi:NosR/NirI family transcriptional regulator, nitrous oxide reductase regulator